MWQFNAFIEYMEAMSENINALVEKYIVLKLFIGLLIGAVVLFGLVALISVQHPFLVGDWLAGGVIIAVLYLAWAIFMVVLHRRAKRDEEVQKMIERTID